MTLLKATFYSLLAAVLFASQHPFSTSLATQNRHGMIGLANLWLASSVISLAGAAILLVWNPSAWSQYRALLSDRSAYGALCFAAGLTVVSSGAYAYGISHFHFSIVSLVLNTSPLWALVVDTKLVPRNERRPLPTYFLPCIGLALLAIGWAYWAGQSKPLLEFALEVLPASVVLLTPLCFVWAYSVRARKFPNAGAMAAVLATMTIAQPLLALAALLVIAVNGGSVGLHYDTNLTLLLYALGTLNVAAFGSIAYQSAIKLADRTTAYPTMFNVLIPGLSALIGLALYAWLGRPELIPNMYQLVAVAFVFLPIAYTVWKKSAASSRPA